MSTNRSYEYLFGIELRHDHTATIWRTIVRAFMFRDAGHRFETTMRARTGDAPSSSTPAFCESRNSIYTQKSCKPACLGSVKLKRDRAQHQRDVCNVAGQMNWGDENAVENSKGFIKTSLVRGYHLRHLTRQYIVFKKLERRTSTQSATYFFGVKAAYAIRHRLVGTRGLNPQHKMQRVFSSAVDSTLKRNLKSAVEKITKTTHHQQAL